MKFSRLPLIIGIVSFLVFSVAIVALIFGDWLAATFDVIGIRIATLFVAFASFVSSSLFGLLIFSHNRTVTKINDDTNRRAELFRELTFASSNYSIIELFDRMLIYDESTRYIDKLFTKNSFDFHMVESRMSAADVMKHPENFLFTSIKIPFQVIEGKVVSRIAIEKIIFERNGNRFYFAPVLPQTEAECYLLYNERTKRNNIIINLITPRSQEFFISSQINLFSKVKIEMSITSLLGVKVTGISELFFTNPEQIEGDGTNTYKINSTNFTLSSMPQITSISTRK